MRIDLTLYKISDGTPLDDATPTIVALKRIEVDGSSFALTVPSMLNDADGQYHADVDDSLLLPGTTVKWIIDAGADASARYYDGEASAGAPLSQSVEVDSTFVDLSVRQGDLGPAFEVVLRDERGARLVLAADAVVQFRMRPLGGVVLQVDEVATVVNGPRGRVKYAWAVGDTDFAGLYEAEFSVTDAGSGDEAVPRTLPATGFYLVEIRAGLSRSLRPPSGLMALWLMNDADDVTVFKDETGQNPLSVQGIPPPLAEGRGGAAAPLSRDFVPDGNSGGAPFGYGLATISSAQRQTFLGGAFSWATWFRPVNRSGVEDAFQNLLCVSASTADGGLWFVVYNSQFATFVTGNSPGGTAQAGALTDGVWTHLAATYEPNGPSDGTFRLYQDGAKVLEETGWAPPSADQPGAYWQLGAGNPTSPDGGLSGQLQDMRVYDRLLADAEIMALAEG